MLSQQWVLLNNEGMPFLSRKPQLKSARTMLVSLIAVCATAGAVSGQQTSASSASQAQLLAQLHSSDAEVRSEAFDQLRSDPVVLRDPKVKIALVNLLDRENKEPIYGEEEDFANYTNWLADTVAKIVDWSDSRQVCVLANSVDLPDELANHAKVSVPCLLRRLKNGQNRYARGPDISRGLIQALAKGRSELDSATRQTLRRTILNALHDPNDDIRIDTENGLAKFGGEDFIPALRVVAEKDPATGEWAAHAIVEIQQRAHPAKVTVNPVFNH
jgi:hypothetical protein